MNLEDNYPGITSQIEQFKDAKLSPCSNCGSENTASVQVGIIGRTIIISSATKKFKLVPNGKDKRGDYFCNNCRKYFNKY